MEFAKPVMGTSVPAPACLAKLSYTFKAVKRAVRKINVMDSAARESFKSRPELWNQLTRNWPNVQIAPPTKKAIKQFFKIGLGGDAFSTFFEYSSFVIFFNKVHPLLCCIMTSIFSLEGQNMQNGNMTKHVSVRKLTFPSLKLNGNTE